MQVREDRKWNYLANIFIPAKLNGLSALFFIFQQHFILKVLTRIDLLPALGHL